LHLGRDVVIPASEVVAIFDIDISRKSGTTRQFIRTAEDLGKIIDVSDGRPKSFVVAEGKVYLSPISPLTLKKRGGSVSALDESE
jgi:regulator of extracellular matrix RemA (YlzA/DUF370 family)